MLRLSTLRRAALLLLVFALLAPARAQSSQVVPVHYFGVAAGDGIYPKAAPTVGPDGNLYGTTLGGGGADGNGIIYKMTPGGTTTTLHSFNGRNGDGADPVAPLVLASDGNFYGTTTNGGANGYGTVFRMTLDGTTTTLHSFVPGAGLTPTAGLVQGADGFLYGATQHSVLVRVDGRDKPGGKGTLFRISLAGDFTLLHTFAPDYSEGDYAYSALIQASDGSFYGTTAGGGASGWGTVFKMTTAGVLTTLHSFAGYPTEGEAPYAGLIQARDGLLYGTTTGGGPNFGGTIYRITPGGAFSTLHEFSNGTGGGDPEAPLVQTADGTFYGTTLHGGPDDPDVIFNFGTAFRLTVAAPAVPIVLALSANAVYGGQSVRGTVTLSGPAPDGGLRVYLFSNTAYALVPPYVLVPAGARTAAFPVSSRPVSQMLISTLRAVRDSTVVFANLRAVPPALDALTVSPRAVRGGAANAVGIVALSGPAPVGGIAIDLRSNTGYGIVPARVMVAAGARTAAFTILTRPVGANKGVTITAYRGGASKAVGLLLTP